jgi:adenosylcobinamide-phosphate synthase
MSLGLWDKILLAFALDLLLGDPRWLPHPVRLIGVWAKCVEAFCRRLPWLYVAGVVGELAVVGVTAGAAFGLLCLAESWQPLARDIVEVLLLYTAFAARDLLNHSARVYQALRAEDLPEARRRVGMIVGRDTRDLDEAGVSRAAVESVAESTVDGVTAPLFFAVLGGAVGAFAYKAINTLDSMWGHKDERYLRYGWAAARTDDVANYLPARLTAPLVAFAALILGLRPWRALRILWRDGRKHPSPNAGLTEAAMAGALGVQLGGTNYYDGEPHERPRQGDPDRPLDRNQIPRANALMLITSSLALFLFLGLRLAAETLWRRYAG